MIVFVTRLRSLHPLALAKIFPRSLICLVFPVVQKTMKAVVKAKAEPGLWLEDVPVPKVGDDDVLIRVLKASICGTDLHIYNWDAWAQKTIPVPMTIGHEFVGVVDVWVNT